jgi:hypothetical protein
MGHRSGFDADGALGEIQQVVDNGSGAVSIAQRQANALTNLGINGGTPANPATGGSTSGTLLTPGTAQANAVVVLDANKSFTGMVLNPTTIDANAATLLLTSLNNGATILLDRAAGCTVTLPTPAAGLTFHFVVKTVTTGGNTYKIITSAGTVFISGGLYFDKSLTITRYDGDTSTIVSVNLNASTTGGATIGDLFHMVCLTSTQWTVEGTVTASGTLATPFATS